jgi:hypothetical protein
VPGENSTTDFSVLQNELPRSFCRLRPAFPQWTRSAEAAAGQAQGAPEENCRRLRHPVQRELRDRRAHACKVGLEGVASKVRDSAYTSGRGNNWVKKTRVQRETLVIAGFARRRQMGRHLCRPPKRRGPDLCRQGSFMASTRLHCQSAEAPDAADPKNATLHQVHRAQGRLRRTEVACRDRVPCQVGGGQGGTSILQRIG